MRCPSRRLSLTGPLPAARRRRRMEFPPERTGGRLPCPARLAGRHATGAIAANFHPGANRTSDHHIPLHRSRSRAGMVPGRASGCGVRQRGSRTGRPLGSRAFGGARCVDGQRTTAGFREVVRQTLRLRLWRSRPADTGTKTRNGQSVPARNGNWRAGRLPWSLSGDGPGAPGGGTRRGCSWPRGKGINARPSCARLAAPLLQWTSKRTGRLRAAGPILRGFTNFGARNTGLAAGRDPRGIAAGGVPSVSAVGAAAASGCASGTGRARPLRSRL